MGKREPQTILKTDERDIASSSGVMGNYGPNQAVGAKTEFASRGDKLEVAIKNARWLQAPLPGARHRRPNCSDAIFGTSETPLHRR
jgi:hypothetical protein